MNPSASRIAARIMNLQDAQAQLNALDELSENISAITDTFELHFRTAAEIDPTVKTQFAALEKSNRGLEQAKAVRQGIQELLKLYPEDKTAQRALADAETMVKRYVTHVNDSQKMIQTISKKLMPAALKKMSKVIADGIRAHLINPDELEVLPWQDRLGDTDYETGRKGACFSVVFRLAPHAEVTVQESTIRSTGPYFMGFQENPGVAIYSRSPNPLTPKTVINAFLGRLAGYSGLKGETEKISGRAAMAKAVKSAVGYVCSQLHSYGVDDVTVSADNRFISSSYQSDLPKDGRYGIDEWRYDEMENRVLEGTKKALDRQLAPYMKSVKKIDIEPSEKGWVYIKVELI